MMPSRTRPNIAFVKSVLACVLAATAMTASAEQRTGIAGSSYVQRTAFSDAEITDGFFKIALGAELDLAGSAERIRKFDGPVRVAVESRAKPDRRSQVADVVRDIRKLVRHLDIAIVDSSAEANVTVRLVHDRDLTRAIVRLYGRERTRQIQRSLTPQCLSSFSRNDTFRITRSNVLIVADAGSFIFYDCIYEELLQALGPINDTKTVPWTMFNDDVRMGFFGVYDQYILNILYDPRIRPGMKPDEVRAVLPQVLPAVKAWVTRINNLEP